MSSDGKQISGSLGQGCVVFAAKGQEGICLGDGSAVNLARVVVTHVYALLNRHQPVYLKWICSIRQKLYFT